MRGICQSLVVLRDYYASDSVAAMLQDNANLASLMQQPAGPEKHSKSSGAGRDIIDILELVESVFANNLATEETEEADAQSEYEKISQENKVTTTSKQQDVNYSIDRETASQEHKAVLDCFGKKDAPQLSLETVV